MFKNVIKYCMMVYMFVACSATMANPHIQTEEPTKNFNKNVSNDLVFYVLGDTFEVDKEFTVPTVLRYFFTPEGTRVQLVHVNQANAESDTKTIWFQNDKYQEKDTQKKSQSSPQAEQEKAKPEVRTL